MPPGRPPPRGSLSRTLRPLRPGAGRLGTLRLAPLGLLRLCRRPGATLAAGPLFLPTPRATVLRGWRPPPGLRVPWRRSARTSGGHQPGGRPTPPLPILPPRSSRGLVRLQLLWRVTGGPGRAREPGAPSRCVRVRLRRSDGCEWPQNTRGRRSGVDRSANTAA